MEEYIEINMRSKLKRISTGNINEVEMSIRLSQHCELEELIDSFKLILRKLTWSEDQINMYFKGEDDE